MEKIYFYKLVSPYPEDETKGCPLTMSEVDQNFLALKDNDIKSSEYDSETMTLTLTKNNGEKLVVDLSGIGDQIDEKIEEAVSGLTPGGCSVEISAELSDDGILTISWTDSEGEKTTEVGGFVTECYVKHDETLSGEGTKESPMSIADNEKAGVYRPVDGIVDSLPSTGLSVGDRYVTKKTVSSFGMMYNEGGMDLVSVLLSSEGSRWRIPSEEDWNKLLNYAEACDDTVHGSDNVGVYEGEVAGKVLKSRKYWAGYTNLDTYGFSAVPAGYVYDDVLEGSGNEARFWSSTEKWGGFLIKGFSGNMDNVYQGVSAEDGWYSIRLVTDIGEDGVGDYAYILGGKYKVINLYEIGQAWIVENLRAEIGPSRCEQYAYPYDDIVSERAYINHWTGKSWETKELSPGEGFSMVSGGTATSYTCTPADNGGTSLAKGARYSSTRMVIDAGWY